MFFISCWAVVGGFCELSVFYLFSIFCFILFPVELSQEMKATLADAWAKSEGDDDVDFSG